MPHNPVSAVDLVLRDVDAVELLLQRVTVQLETEPQTDLDWVHQRHLRFLTPAVQQLTAALARPLAPRPSTTLDAMQSQNPRAQSEPTPDPSPAETAAPPPASATPGKDQRPKRRKNRRRPPHR
ncbi:hypothetical protein C5E51_34550 [Nocardia nova]|uniref:hypothetical protein n=1 Tax=Nocardia nova TaxID=37330 RepID=UPI000CE9D6A4|nr:hypothetical protein [Nocardia nova]PPJ01236.1 hypothetical protein C5E51_34550 [Nocardia nova]